MRKVATVLFRPPNASSGAGSKPFADDMAAHPDVTGNHFLDSLPGADREALRPFLTVEEIQHGQLVSAVGAEVAFVYFPVTAILSLTIHMVDGQGVETSTIGRESGYGLLNALGDRTSWNEVYSQVGGRCYRLSADRLRQAALDSPAVMGQIVRHAQANAAQIDQSVACNAFHPVEARLCRWLLMSHDRAGASALPLTPEFLGFMLGVQRTTVTAAAQALQSAGLIRYRRGNIDIVDRKGLEHGACECYAAVQQKLGHILS